MPMVTAPSITFRCVTSSDLPILTQWISSPHWQKWWGPTEPEIDHIRDMIEGRDSTRPFIFELDGSPTGYIQAWDIGPHQTEEWVKDNPWLSDLPSDAVGVDLSIGPEDKLSQGVGSTVLKIFAQCLARNGHRTIIIDPDPDNTRAVRAYTKAGFRPVPPLEGKTVGVLIMQFQTD